MSLEIAFVMTFKLGLTGSIGWENRRLPRCLQSWDPVWDADAAVHKLYSRRRSRSAIQELYPEAIEHGEFHDQR